MSLPRHTATNNVWRHREIISVVLYTTTIHMSGKDKLTRNFTNKPAMKAINIDVRARHDKLAVILARFILGGARIPRLSFTNMADIIFDDIFVLLLGFVVAGR